jgi:hypothetical protein
MIFGESRCHSNEMATACNEWARQTGWRKTYYKRAIVKDFSIVTRAGLSSC